MASCLNNEQNRRSPWSSLIIMGTCVICDFCVIWGLNQRSFAKVANYAPTDKVSWGSAICGPAVSIRSKKRRAPKAELDSISGKGHSGKTGCNHTCRRPAAQTVRGPLGHCGHRVNLHGRAQSTAAEEGRCERRGEKPHHPSIDLRQSLTPKQGRRYKIA